MIGLEDIPLKALFEEEWALIGYPIYSADSTVLQVYVESEGDLLPYTAPVASLYLPNKDQVITWTIASDDKIEFKWDIIPAVRPFDHFPDSISIATYFVTQIPGGRNVIKQKLADDSRSMTLSARELHRAHSGEDTLMLSVDIDWSVAVLNGNDPLSLNHIDLDWVPFRLIRLTALYETDIMDIPKSFTLESARPNPFNPTTTIRVNVPSIDRLNIQLYDVLGRSVKTIHSGTVLAGVHDIIIEAGRLPSGVYIIRANYKDTVLSQLITLVK